MYTFRFVYIVCKYEMITCDVLLNKKNIGFSYSFANVSIVSPLTFPLLDKRV